MHEGFSVVTVSLQTQDGGRLFEFDKRARWSTGFAAEIKGLFGLGALSQLETAPQASTEDLAESVDLIDGDVTPLVVEQGHLVFTDETADDVTDDDSV
jgi:hypothetical protein